MAKLTKRYIFEFDQEEIELLLIVLGKHSPDKIRELGASTEAFEEVWSVLSNAAYAPMREDSV